MSIRRGVLPPPGGGGGPMGLDGLHHPRPERPREIRAEFRERVRPAGIHRARCLQPCDRRIFSRPAVAARDIDHDLHVVASPKQVQRRLESSMDMPPMMTSRRPVAWSHAMKSSVQPDGGVWGRSRHQRRSACASPAGSCHSIDSPCRIRRSAAWTGARTWRRPGCSCGRPGPGWAAWHWMLRYGGSRRRGRCRQGGGASTACWP